MLLTRRELDRLVRPGLSKKRYEHTLAVTKLSLELAACYNLLPEEALNAAMLHDITKEVDIEEQLQMLENSAIINSNILMKSPNIYHAITAYYYAKDQLKLENADVLNAIRYHTTGRKNMSMLEKIVFTADTVSYDRDYDEAKKLRKLSFLDLDGCMLEITRFIISNLAAKSQMIELDTIECYNQLLVSNRH